MSMLYTNLYKFGLQHVTVLFPDHTHFFITRCVIKRLYSIYTYLILEELYYTQFNGGR